jgi:AcrR family transcriptional regulator
MVTTRGDKQPGDRRVRRTQAALARALIELVGDQELSRITVADVAERADVNRSTFYAHYRDVHELAEAACTELIDELIESLSALDRPDKSCEDPPPSLLGFFTHLADHAGLYRSLLGPGGSARVIDHILRRTTAAIHRGRYPAEDASPVESGSTSEAPHDVPAGFAAGGLIGVAVDWLHRGRPQTPTEVATLTFPLIAPLSGQRRTETRAGADVSWDDREVPG